MKQRYSWDCGVACVAMALGVTWEDARALLPEPRKGGYMPFEIAAVFSAPMYYGRTYLGSLEDCILQVSLREGEMAHHFVWSCGGLQDPAEVCTGWGLIKSIDTVIPINGTRKEPSA